MISGRDTRPRRLAAWVVVGLLAAGCATDLPAADPPPATDPPPVAPTAGPPASATGPPATATDPPAVTDRSPGTDPSPVAPTAGPPATGAPGGTDEASEMTINPALDRIIGLAAADLAERLGISADDITVVSAEAVTWPDGSLGCPQPDMRYTQVPQDGARVVLDVDGRRYRYHTGGRRTTPFLCQQRPPKAPLQSPTRKPPRPATPE